jgi:antitoxin component YwqK of YwqJK toxin-antitoxin module
MKRLLAASLILIAGCKPATSPSADLSSQSQEVRDAAAKILRANAKPPSKLKWILLMARIRHGENKTNVLKLLRPYNVMTYGGVRISSFGPYYEDYQLDDYWILECRYQDNDSLMERKLGSGWRPYAVWPSTKFTGVWINYYANGQKFTECCYTNGFRDGDFLEYSADGSKKMAIKYDHGHEQSRTVYYPSGRIHQQMQSRDGHIDGLCIDYNEDGSTNYIADNRYGAGVHQRIVTGYFPSGHIKSVDQQSNGASIRILFNEDGSTNSISDIGWPRARAVTAPN